MSVVLYVLLNRFTGHLVANCLDKIAVLPEFPTPQLSFYLWIPAENLLRTHALDNPDDISHRILRRNAREYVYMILRYLHLFNLTVSRCQNLSKQLFYRIANLIFEYPLALFRCPYQMVSRIINRMTQTLYAHAAHYTKLLHHWNPFLPVLPHGVSRVSSS